MIRWGADKDVNPDPSVLFPDETTCPVCMVGYSIRLDAREEMYMTQGLEVSLKSLRLT